MRAADRRTTALVAGGYAVVGIGLGIVGVAAGDWARAQFLADAGGAVGEFGPTYLALSAAATATAGMLALVVLGGVVGALAGTGYVDPRRAAAVGAAAGTGGAAVATLALLAGVAGGTAGEASDQVFSLGQALVPGVVTVVVAGGVTAGAAALGAGAGE
ncbi:hypothetical protein Hbl1158_10700 [Halobaculum sp. CBA1158]|uniref:hypothetical protein n=1 Tax=Halobaculum sp. CBA1158 TaxID=2904243 RepID=UPI001F1A73C3|nr:hypothetical protein [Halobaculum sp. CBA1158]UIO99002.1 hypothetical protein Hbl1158_10700 [Halobaculum sp. CBA1158]